MSSAEDMDPTAGIYGCILVHSISVFAVIVA